MIKTKWVVKTKISDDLEEQLLHNLGITDKDTFFKPSISKEPIVDKEQLKIAVARIRKAIENKESIHIYGDFDVDGVTATAVLWETLDNLGAKVMPYIPHREKEGYGLSEVGLDEIKKAGGSLVISVDCGVSAIEQAKYAKELGLDLIITDHHQKADRYPECLAVLHTYELCGVGVAYELADSLYLSFDKGTPTELLDLVALGTISDMVPLVGKNRALVKAGLEQLGVTKRLGLKALLEVGGTTNKPGVYEVGFVIGPRLNAMGRMEHAYDSLRILLTRDKGRAKELAEKLNLTNQERQHATRETLEHANKLLESEGDKKLFVIYHDTYQQGVIGLVAGRLTDKYSRPVLVISKGESVSKGSARSIPGFNIVEAIRSCSDILVNAGGHPAAAGFTIENDKIEEFKKRLDDWANDKLTDAQLLPTLKIEYELPSAQINLQTHTAISKFAPFGMANPEPVFVTQNLRVDNIRLLGDESKHLKLLLNAGLDVSGSRFQSFEAIGFGIGSRGSELKAGAKIDVAYTLLLDSWNGREKLTLKIKDFRPHSQSSD